MEDPVLDEAFMRRYRELLDAEDNAFDELEHAYEDGDRQHFETDYAAWQSVLGRKLAFLELRGIRWRACLPPSAPLRSPPPRST